MSRAKPKSSKTTKEQDNQRIRDLEARKERDRLLNYQYSPCVYCGEAARWRWPTGKEAEKEKYEPKHCGKEDCQKKFMDAMMDKKRSK